MRGGAGKTVVRGRGRARPGHWRERKLGRLGVTAREDEKERAVAAKNTGGTRKEQENKGKNVHCVAQIKLATAGCGSLKARLVRFARKRKEQGGV